MHIQKYLLLSLSLTGLAGCSSEKTVFQQPVKAPPYEFTLDNPISEEWISKHLSPEHPRILLDQEKLAVIRAELADGDSLTSDYYAWIKWNADEICEKPVLERKMSGKRLLGVSREALNRITCLALAAQFEADPAKYIERLNDELLAVCAFENWNPSHFLDVGEMALAVSIGLDWAHGQLPESTLQIGKEALINLALKPSMSEGGGNWWVDAINNWNQVCHGGLVAAAVMVAEDEPELAAAIISRALEQQPRALEAYWPDGIYPESVAYWEYGTYYSVFTVEVYRTAFGTDFNLTQSPGFIESALFARLMVSPTGQNYDFFDCYGWMRPISYWPLLAWFDVEVGERSYFSGEQYRDVINQLHSQETPSKWFEALPFVWIARLPAAGAVRELPENWVGRGKNPLVVFRQNDDPRGFYFGAKGGSASLPHGNMDAGSFIYELDGIRWGIDTGNQRYETLESVKGLDLWNGGQDSSRWSLLTKGNHFHNTITVNDERHLVKGNASMAQVDATTVKIDMTEIFGANVKKAIRTIQRSDTYEVTIHDEILPSSKTKKVVWAFLTQATVSIDSNTVTLQANGQSIVMKVLEPKNAKIVVVPLDPPPLGHDRKIPGLKRIEIVQESDNLTPIKYRVVIGE